MGQVLGTLRAFFIGKKSHTIPPPPKPTPTAEVKGSSSEPETVAIIGGGIGGVILAIGLIRRGVPAHIYHGKEAFGEIGAGVTVGPNAVRALTLNSPDLATAFHKHVTCNSDHPKSFLAFRRGVPLSNDDKDGWLFDLSSDETAPNWTELPARMAAHRGRFLDEIVKLLPPDCVSFNKALANIEEVSSSSSGGNKVKLTFSDGTSVISGIVIGCDGAHSVARRFVHGTESVPTFSGEYAYRALVPADVYVAKLGRERALNGQLYVGEGGTVTTYPVERGSSINMIALRHLPEDNTNSGWEGKSWLAPATEADLRADFVGWDPRLLELLTEYGTGSKWAVFHYLHDLPYFRGPVCLLGDSAHATTPNMGAGAGQAMEDAFVLAGLLSELPPTGGDEVRRVFTAYDAVRRPRAQKVVEWSRLCGMTYTLQDEDVGHDFVKMKTELNRRFRWLLDADLRAHFDEAKAML